jgi:hypothetical protein
MDVGDSVEVGITVEVKHPRKGSIWVKAGATGHIRPGESPKDAAGRIRAYVASVADETVKEYLDV